MFSLPATASRDLVTSMTQFFLGKARSRPPTRPEGLGVSFCFVPHRKGMGSSTEKFNRGRISETEEKDRQKNIKGKKEKHDGDDANKNKKDNKTRVKI